MSEHDVGVLVADDESLMRSRIALTLGAASGMSGVGAAASFEGVALIEDIGPLLAWGPDRSRLFQMIGQEARSKRVTSLGSGDRAVLRWIARGASNQQIAAVAQSTLGSAKKTVSCIPAVLDVHCYITAVLAGRTGLGPGHP